MRAIFTKLERKRKRVPADVLRAVSMDEALAERSFAMGDVPGNFRVVFYLGSDEEGGDALAWKSLAMRKLLNIRGISANGAIEAQFLGVARDAVLVMPGRALVRENKLTRIMYDNIHYLLSDDMRAFKRIVQASTYDAGRARSHAARVFLEYLFKVLKAENKPQYRDLLYQWEYAGLGSSWAMDFAHSREVNNVREFVRELLKIVRKRATDVKKGVSDRSRYSRIALEEMEKWSHADWLKLLAKVAKDHVQPIYGDEGEWVSKGDSLKIPDGSTLRILTRRIPSTIADLYKANYPDGGKPGFFEVEYKGFGDALARRAYLLERLNALGVLKRYDVEWIYQDDFERERETFWRSRHYEPPSGTRVRPDESLTEAMPSSARTTFDSAPYANMRLLDVARLLQGASSQKRPNVQLITKLVDRLVHALEFTIYSIQGRPEGRRIGNMIRSAFNNLTARLPELVVAERRQAAGLAVRLNEALETLDLGPVEAQA